MGAHPDDTWCQKIDGDNLAEVRVRVPLALNLLRIATAGKQLLVGGEAGPAVARRTAEGVLARRSRVMGEVIGS
jgi:hypothetical protein